MNKLITKARSGVTLVELLVVILIVTILSVTMLPLLQPFVTEAQYAAEAIPVLGNLRTKIGLYQYNKGCLPYNATEGDKVHTWTTVSGDTESFIPVCVTLTSDGKISKGSTAVSSDHLSHLIDVNFQELKGKRSRPSHYEYYPISVTNFPSYAIGCFGDGDGLKAGTGYAICEINFKDKKFLGTWSRYKQGTNSVAVTVHFGSDQSSAEKDGDYCYVPSASAFDPASSTSATGDGLPTIITNMKAAGWEF